jgi:hypothetical protein
MEERLSTSLKKKAILERLIETRGIIGKSCIEVGISRTMFWEWLKKDPKFKEAYNEILEQKVDWAETHLDDIIKDKNLGATTWFLKNKGKHRGWSDKTEVDQTVNINQPIEIKIVKPE